ncbi:MAG: DUF4252 domain-containing protein [Bacteroidetes bacterium]|nr:DUF4252 domain-containing protein [Bacteroidota bacterium]
MKTFLSIICFLFFAHTLSAQDGWLYWKYKDYDGMAFTVPRWVVDAGSWFLDEKAERKLLRRVDKVRFMVFENDMNPVSDRDMKKFTRKAHRRELEDLVVVRDGKTQVRVMGKEKRGILRKVVVLVHSPEDFVFVSVKGRLRLNDINHIIEKYDKEDKGKKDKPMVPPVVKIPVSRV